MKCIQILNHKNTKLINTVTRVNNELASEMVRAGNAAYASKVDWKNQGRSYLKGNR